MKRLYGLIGFPLNHSFSKKYFSEKFAKENVNDARFELFPLEHISEFPLLIKNQAELRGLSVTIPYKEKVKDYLDRLDDAALEIGAVNSIKISRKGHDVFLEGYNTDAPGFSKSLSELGLPCGISALVLGSGGASKAVTYVLKQKNIDYKVISRNPSSPSQLSYNDINQSLLKEFRLIVNCTPLGTFPEVNQSPLLPYHHLTKDHYLFDLVYNPPLTEFLEHGRSAGCVIENGYNMLRYQAEYSWQIWNQG